MELTHLCSEASICITTYVSTYFFNHFFTEYYINEDENEWYLWIELNPRVEFPYWKDFLWALWRHNYHKNNANYTKHGG